MRNLLFFLVGLSMATSAAIEPIELRCEHLENPRGIDIQAPRFFWKLHSAEDFLYHYMAGINLDTKNPKSKSNELEDNYES